MSMSPFCTSADQPGRDRDGSGAGPDRPSAGVRKSRPPDGHDPNGLWSALGHDPTPLDVLAERTGLTVAALSSMLLAMELDGHVVNDHGRYARRP